MTQKKNNENDIIENVDKCINELVYEKTQLIKAYNYYHGKRDPEQFRHLEENYGIGTPTSIEFVPLVKKHIDVLIGEYISMPVLPKISCKDKNTLSNIHRDKQIAINNTVIQELNTHLRNAMYNAMAGKDVNDPEVEKRILEAKESTEKNFISDYEIAGQNIVDYSLQARAIDFANKRKILLTHLLVTGTLYYKVDESKGKTNVDLRVLNPLNTFIDRNPNSPYLKDSYRSVVREYMTKQQILHKYGEFLKPEDIDVLESMHKSGEDGTTSYLRSYDAIPGNTMTDGILGGYEITPLIPFERSSSKYFRLFPVYEVEWLQADKEGTKYVTNRYTGVRIGSGIYITFGKDEKVIRSMDNPDDCHLSVNGMFYSDINGDPFSLVLSTANLQDKYDCINFVRDNIIAESGGIGDWVDVAHLPIFLGSDIPERLMKFKAYKKTGLAPYDSSQEGDVVNTTFSGYDDTIKVQTIQALNLAMQQIEETCSTITGVFRERLGGIEQKDAVTNVQVGVTQSALVTKQYNQIMDLITREILIDILNVAKIVFKNGLTGTIILGERLNKIFTALPEHFTTTDYDIHITDSSELKKELETMKQLSMEFIKNNLMSPDIIMEIVTASGLTSMKAEVNKALGKQKAENSQTAQLNQQVQSLDQQLKQAQQELQKAAQQVETLNAEKLKIDKQKVDDAKELGWYKAKADSQFNTSKLELDKKRIDLEGLQLLDDNHNNDEIKDN